MVKTNSYFVIARLFLLSDILYSHPLGTSQPGNSPSDNSASEEESLNSSSTILPQPFYKSMRRMSSFLSDKLTFAGCRRKSSVQLDLHSAKLPEEIENAKNIEKGCVFDIDSQTNHNVVHAPLAEPVANFAKPIGGMPTNVLSLILI